MSDNNLESKWLEEKRKMREEITRLQNFERRFKKLEDENSSLKLKLSNQITQNTAIQNRRGDDLKNYEQKLKKMEEELKNEKQINKALAKELSQAHIDSKNFQADLTLTKASAASDRNGAKRKISDLIQKEKQYICDGKRLKKELSRYKERKNIHSSPQIDILEYYRKNKLVATQQMKIITKKRPDLHIKEIKMENLIINMKEAIEGKVKSNQIKDNYQKVNYKLALMKPEIEFKAEFAELRKLITCVEESAKLLGFI